MDLRTVGVEEELLLVDAESGRPRAVAGHMLRQNDEAGSAPDDGEVGGSLGYELQQQQIETDTKPHTNMSELATEVQVWRNKAITAARAAGARVVASGTSPVPVEPRLFRNDRFEQMVEHFGLTTSEQLACGCHVHVSVDSDEEGVAVLDRIREWLPPLLAISANSPFWQGLDTRYASFRSQAMARWPSAGPTEVFGSALNYHRVVRETIGSGVLLDEGMVYFDARLSHHYPTVEIRIADVCLDASDTALIAALCRGLVETASRAWKAGSAPDGVPTSVLRLANWRAGRDGIAGDLLDPHTFRPRPAHEIISTLVDHVRPALRDSGDESFVEEQLRQVVKRGNGAVRQRATMEKTGHLTDVIADLARITAGQEGQSAVAPATD